MNISLAPRALVDYAPRRERFWGPWQFPALGYDARGRVILSVSDTQDSFSGYGRNMRPPYALDEATGEWLLPAQGERYSELVEGVKLINGDMLRLYDNVCARHDEVSAFAPAGEFTINKRHYTAYRACDLPVEYSGLPLMRKRAGEAEYSIEYAKIIEPNGLRCAANGLLPAWQARGMQLVNAPDGALLFLGYNFQLDGAGKPDPRDRVILFRSKDNGHTFEQLSVIPYKPDIQKDPRAMSDLRRGFLEPRMCFVTDTHIVCVIRTYHYENGPMYICHSYDGGASWTEPAWLHDHGVLPRLILLRSGVLALSFGRPGVDMLFSSDGGVSFGALTHICPVTDPKPDHDSCGYTDMLATADDELMIAYTDFRYDPGDGYPRKALFTRRVRVNA